MYPAGLAVATVLSVEHKSADAFARIVCQPIAGVDRHQQFLILLNEQKTLPRPAPEETKKEKGPKRKMKDPGREAAKDAAGAAPALTAAATAATAAPAAAPANVAGHAARSVTRVSAPAKPSPAEVKK